MSNRERGPDFIIVGPQKTGSTSLYFDLLQHPQLVGPEEKELHFFDHTEKFDRGPEYYHSCFPEAAAKQIVFESTPNYFVNASARSRIYDYNPRLKIIILLRNPVHRFVSQFFHFHAMALDDQTLKEEGKANEKWEGDSTRLDDIFERYRAGREDPLHYFASGEYIVHLREWENMFGRENIHYVLSDEFAADPALTVGKVLRFINLPQCRLKNQRHNRKYDWLRKHPELSEQITDDHVHALYEHYRPYNQALYDYFKKDYRWEEQWI